MSKQKLAFELKGESVDNSKKIKEQIHIKTESDQILTHFDSQLIKGQSDFVNTSLTDKQLNSRQIVKDLLDKVKSIYNQLNDKTPAWLKIQKNVRSQDKAYFPNNRKQISTQGGKSSNILISGLISYNFNSVKARTRLAYDTQGTQRQVENTVNKAKKLSNCSIARRQKIHFKTCPDEALNDKQFNQTMTHNYGNMPTDQYLEYIQVQKQNNQRIYGSKSKQVSNISKIMTSDQTNQQVAQFTIEQFKLLCRPSYGALLNSNKKVIKRQKFNEDVVFEGRRLPIKKSKIIINSIQVD